MSYEFHADIDGSGDLPTAILAEVSNDAMFEVLAISDSDTIRVRVASNEKNVKWPEDIEIRSRPGRLEVIVHSATRPQREHLLLLLERAIVRAGCRGTLVED